MVSALEPSGHFSLELLRDKFFLFKKFVLQKEKVTKKFTCTCKTLCGSKRLLRCETKRLEILFEVLDTPLYKSFTKAALYSVVSSIFLETWSSKVSAQNFPNQGDPSTTPKKFYIDIFLSFNRDKCQSSNSRINLVRLILVLEWFEIISSPPFTPWTCWYLPHDKQNFSSPPKHLYKPLSKPRNIPSPRKMIISQVQRGGNFSVTDCTLKFCFSWGWEKFGNRGRGLNHAPKFQNFFFQKSLGSIWRCWLNLNTCKKSRVTFWEYLSKSDFENILDFLVKRATSKRVTQNSTVIW